MSSTSIGGQTLRTGAAPAGAQTAQVDSGAARPDRRVVDAVHVHRDHRHRLPVCVLRRVRHQRVVHPELRRTEARLHARQRGHHLARAGRAQPRRIRDRRARARPHLGPHRAAQHAAVHDAAHRPRVAVQRARTRLHAVRAGPGHHRYRRRRRPGDRQHVHRRGRSAPQPRALDLGDLHHVLARARCSGSGSACS